MDLPKRSLVKSLTWRIIAFATTVIAVYIYSGDIKESLIVGIGANSVKIFLYYMHERIWNKLDFGRTKEPEYQI
ncbi:MAG: DUF2061 domain-containing protein [Candidatus Ancaeobacter aquaticus]|nr:DUF2061 domain-containing protein [Candidatus Ancaeobacter aquaticus]